MATSKLTGLVKNIRMYDCSTSSIVHDGKAMAELTYFYVPLRDTIDCETFFVFSDELAAELFATSIHSVAYCDFHFVSIPR